MATLENKRYPDHIAIMMDGNGRWASNRMLPRSAGHYAGMLTMRKMINVCLEKNMKCLTLYAFSTENWRRPEDEVRYLVNLPELFFRDQTLEEITKSNIQIRYIGDLSRFPNSSQDILQKTSQITKENTGMILNFAMNYGGRAEILQAVKNYIHDYDECDELTEEKFENYLYSKDIGAPDLIIRTSGEQRLSNFLLWQAPKAELWFTTTLWPDFNEKVLEKAINDYIRRKKGI